MTRKVVKRKAATRKRKPTLGSFERITGAVWCDRHGDVHEESLDPYDYEEPDRCLKSEHRPIYFRVRDGDY